MEQPSIGIGLPVFRNEKFLAETLDSILNQSYQNIVVYLVDDQSDDNTAEMCREYAQRDSRIKFSQNEANLGEIGNHQRVLDLAETDFFMFSRGHEILPENLVQDCLDALLANNEAVLAFSKSVWIDEDGNRLDDRQINYSDTQGCDVATRCALVIWGKCESFYGLTRTSVIKNIRALEPIVATDLIMLFEMALRGSFAHINTCERYRRYYYDNEPYKDRIKRYQRTLYTDIGLFDKLFPFAKVPFILFSCVFKSDHPWTSKLLLLFVIIFNAPLKYFSSRGKTL